MSPTILRAILQRRPFRPLVLRTTSGAVHEVRHPEMMAVLGQKLVVVMDPDGSVDWFEAEAVSDVRRKGRAGNGRSGR